MAQIETIFNQDLKKPVQVHHLGGNIFSADNQGNIISFRLFDNGEPFNAAGTVSANIVRSDGGTVAISSGLISGNKVSVTLPSAAYAVVGPIVIVVKLSYEGTVTTIGAVAAVCYRSSTDSPVDPGDIIPSVQDLINQINAVKDTIPQDYSALSQNVSELNGAVNVMGGGLTRITGFVNKKGYNTSSPPIDINNPTTNNAVMCTYVACQEGDKFTYTGYTTSSYRGWAFINSSGAILNTLPSAGQKTHEVITAPAGTAYVVFNVNNGYAYSVWKGALKEKQDALTFDETPTYLSVNPVKSNGIFDYSKAFELFTGIRVIPNFLHKYGYNTTGTTINVNSPTYNLSVDCKYVECSAGDRFTYTGRGSSSYYSYAFLDSSGNILSKQNFQSEVSLQKTNAAPEGSAYAVFNCLNSFRFSVWKGVLSEEIPVDPGSYDWRGKNVAIIGDSISTNGNYIQSGKVNPLGNIPEIIITQADVDAGVELSAYVTYYDKNTVLHGNVTIDGVTTVGHTISEDDVGKEISFVPVIADVTTPPTVIGKPKNNNDPETVTWWEVAASVLGFNPIPVCWSGSSITGHEENSLDDGHYIYKCAHAWHESQIRKCGVRTPGTMTRTAPDVIIIYRGTNDLSHSPYSRLTDDLDTSPTTYPDVDTYNDGGSTRYSYVKGMKLLIKKLREAYPEAKIVICTLNYFRRLSSTAKYTNNGTDNWLTYNAMIRRIADYEGCELIEFDKDGLTWANAKNGYYNEGTSSTAKWTHPNTLGHAKMGSRALVDMRRVNDVIPNT